MWRRTSLNPASTTFLRSLKARTSRGYFGSRFRKSIMSEVNYCRLHTSALTCGSALEIRIGSSCSVPTPNPISLIRFGDRSCPQCVVRRCAADHRHALRVDQLNQRHAVVDSFTGDGISDLHRWTSLRTASESLRWLCASSRRLSDICRVHLHNANELTCLF